MTTSTRLIRQIEPAMKQLFFAMMLALPLVAAEPDMKALLEQGLVAEEVNGDLEAAAAAYQKLVVAGEAQQRFLATGLFRLAEVRRKQGQRDETAALLQRLVAEHPAQKELVERARETLAGMGVTPPEPPADLAMSTLDEEEAKEIARMERLLRESPDRAKKEHPLHLAAEKGWLELARRMIESGFDVNQVYYGSDASLRKWTSKTPLALAAEIGHKDMCGLLLDAKVDINEGGAISYYPVRMAIEHRNEAVLEMLLEAGVSVDGRLPLTPPGMAVSSETAIGTPLHLACRIKSLNMVRLLLQAGAEVDAVTKIEQADASDQSGSNAAAGAGRTPLFYAIGSKDIIDTLLEAGASLEATDDAGRTALFYTYYLDNPKQPGEAVSQDTLTAFVRAGANLNVRDREGVTPLLFRVEQSGLGSPNWTMPRKLVSLGVDLSAVDAQGNGLLHYAASSDKDMSDDAVEWLMTLPLDPSVKNKAGKTTLELALANDKTNTFFAACLMSTTLAPSEGVWWCERELPLRRIYTAMSENEPPPELVRGWLLATSSTGWVPLKKLKPEASAEMTPTPNTSARRRLLIAAPMTRGITGLRADLMFIVSKASSFEKAFESVQRVNMLNLNQASSLKLQPGDVLFCPGPLGQDTFKSIAAVLEKITVRQSSQEKEFDLLSVDAATASRLPGVWLWYAHYGSVITTAAATLKAGYCPKAKLIRQIDGKPVERIIDLETEDPSTWPRPITGDVLELLPEQAE